MPSPIFFFLRRTAGSLSRMLRGGETVRNRFFNASMEAGNSQFRQIHMIDLKASEGFINLAV